MVRGDADREAEGAFGADFADDRAFCLVCLAMQSLVRDSRTGTLTEGLRNGKLQG